jgi:hypothetical protein
MNQRRLGVSCRFCGQPIVLHDVRPGEALQEQGQSRAIVMRCMSCGQRDSYRRNAFHTFESAEMASGDWEAVADLQKTRLGTAHRRRM